MGAIEIEERLDRIMAEKKSIRAVAHEFGAYLLGEAGDRASMQDERQDMLRVIKELADYVRASGPSAR
jgi:hypothetical protein